MPTDIPALRILPMSDKIAGFRNRSIPHIQSHCFLRDLPANHGRFRYPSTGLNADPGTVVLFQFQARIIASAIFIRDEKFPKPVAGSSGVLHFEPQSFRTFDPIDALAMRKIWPAFRAFGHVKQHLNPLRYPAFTKQLQHVAAPAAPKPAHRTTRDQP